MLREKSVHGKTKILWDSWIKNMQTLNISGAHDSVAFLSNRLGNQVVWCHTDLKTR